MGDVTRIDRFTQRKPEFVFECHCGSQHFYLHQDGLIECRGCHIIIDKIEWIYASKKEPA